MSELWTIEQYKNFRKLKKGKNKYNAKRQTYNGYSYDSIFEAHVAESLDWKIKAGEIKEWYRQHRFDLRVNGIHICYYKIDFKIIHNDDSIEFVEAKGVQTYSWKLKWNLLLALIDEIEPGAKLTILK